MPVRSSAFDREIDEGIEAIIKKHPRFESHEADIEGSIDLRRLHSQLAYLTSLPAVRRMPPTTRANYIHKNLVSYIENGGALNPEGKEVILKAGLREKAKNPINLFAHWKLGNENYLDRAIKFARDLENLPPSTGMPAEVYELGQSLRDLGWKDAVTDLMGYRGLMTKGEYRRTKRQHIGEAERYVGKLKSYTEKATAAIFGVLGISLLVASGLNLTGGVIGSALGKNLLTGVIGSILVISALALLLKKPRKR